MKKNTVSQIRRSAVSISSNIAKGYGIKTTGDYIRLLYISYGSVCELETQILLARDLGLIEKGELGTAKKHSRNLKNVKSADKNSKKQTLDRIAPRKYRLLRKGRGELYKIESILTGKPALKGGTLQSLDP